ncbi:MAG: putative rane protein YckC, family [Thermoleophilia bacterium]|nr:putative rane protein YckC, family [Thermoleophilia bacterium]
MQTDEVFAAADYARFGARLVAFVIDSFILTIVTFVVFFGATLANGGELHLETFGTFAVLVGTGVAWDVLWIAGPSRGKPGQRAAGFLVLDERGARVTPRAAVVRAVVKAVSFGLFAVAFLVDAVTIAATPRRQSVHDMFASTVCVVSRAVSESSSVQHVPTAAQRARPVAAPAQSEQSRQQGPFL